MPEKFKPVSNKDTNYYEQMRANLVKYLSENQWLYQPITVFHDLECIIQNYNEQAKLQELKTLIKKSRILWKQVSILTGIKG